MRSKGFYRKTAMLLAAVLLLFAGAFPANAETVPVSSDLRFGEVILEMDTLSDLVFRIPSSSLSGFTSPQVAFELDGVETTVSDYTVSDEYACFVLPGIAADQLNKPVSARLTAVADGVRYTGNETQRSALEYSLSAFDINEDKAVTIQDLIRLKKYMARAGSVYISPVADPKKDDRMDTDDMTALQKYLLLAPLLSEINRLPDYPNSAVAEISKTGKQNVLGTYTGTADRVSGMAVGGSVSLSVADRIELDFYVEDHNAFATAVAGKGLCFFVASGETNTDGRAGYDIVGQIEKDGWNHIVLKKSFPDENSGADFTAVRWFGLAFRDGSGSNPAAGMEIRIVNICGTKQTSGNWTEADDDF